MHHTPRKRFSQNFLTDSNVITAIVNAIHPQPGDQLVEIGPGLGALTKKLLPLVGEMDAIELDRDLLEPLAQACSSLGKLQLHAADALSFDYRQLARKSASLRIVGNLPYQISTPLLFYLLNYIDIIQDMHFMLQKEVVDRLAAQPGSKTYGRLSVMLQYHLTAKSLFIVKPQAFHPVPKVTSAVVRLIPRTISLPAKNYQHFSEIVKQAFNYRRKTLHNSLKDLVDSATLNSLGINPQQRPETLSVEDFVKISNAT